MRSKYDCRTTSPSGPGSSENIQRIGWFTANTQRPPGRSTRATSRITCPGSATNGTAPNAEHARSNAPSRNGSCSASAWTSGTAAPVDRPSVGGVAEHAARRGRAPPAARPPAAATASTGPSPRRPRARGRPRRRRAAARPAPAAPPGTRRSRLRRCQRRVRRGSRRRRRPTTDGWRAGTRPRRPAAARPRRFPAPAPRSWPDRDTSATCTRVAHVIVAPVTWAEFRGQGCCSRARSRRLRESTITGDRSHGCR